MNDSRTVANRFLELARDEKDDLTPMQLLKLVYIAHGWMLGLYKRSLIKDEVQAWQYGPVIPELYRSIRQFGSQPVLGRLATSDIEELDQLEDDIVQQVYQIYGKRSGIELSRLTHKPDTPWAQTYRSGHFGSVIPTDLIQQHYEALAN